MMLGREVSMWCAQCGQKMTRLAIGAWQSCCANLGYWANVSPLPRDTWMPILQRNRRTFYPTVKWPAGILPEPLL